MVVDDFHVACVIGMLGLLYIGVMYFGQHLISIEDRLEAVERSSSISQGNQVDAKHDWQHRDENS